MEHRAALQSAIVGQVWTIVLGGGSGTRLSSLTNDATGNSVPKQFCSLDGTRSLIEQTLTRAATVSVPQRITVVVTALHRQYWETALEALPSDNIVLPKLASFVTLSRYGDDFNLPCAYTQDPIHNGFGEYISNLGLKQLRIAETEKYAHVTYFFNGGREQPYPGEERILVPSPKVATYDLKPEMSAFEVTDKLEAAILSRQFQAIICNYANGDMVGHSGNMAAATLAIEALDICIGRVVKAMRSIGGEVIITADHGNAEQMLDRVTHQAHTAHTLNPVPFLYIGRAAKLKENGSLRDLAPSLLAMMGLPQPPEMTGHSLIRMTEDR